MSFSVRVSVVLALFVLKTSETNAFKQSPLLVKETAILDDVLAAQHQNLQEGQTPYGSSSSEMPPTDYKRVTAGDLGTARGTILKSFMGRDFYAFMSIPYAQPPVGDLRFRNPEPWEGPWPQEVDGDYEATWLRAKCPQISLILDVISGREDCLHLSIYTPLLPEDMEASSSLPVMFWIHGGAYTTGDASLYVPTKLMDRDVVVVVVQYRLASLGFLAGGIPEAPGNMGLLDQIMALRWVQDYISYFGGDPNLVTVFGQSAGGASASWLQLTPLTNVAYKDYLYPKNHTPNDTDFMRDQALHMIISAFGIDDKNGAITDTMQVAYLPYATMGDWDTMVGGMIDMGGVMFLKAGLWELVHYVNRVAPDEVPVYFYSWEFEADDSLFPWIFLSMPDIPVPGGISHADELLYLFHLPSDLDDRQKVMVERMLTLWTNFAICGNPTPDDGECQSEEWKGEIEKWQTFSLTQPNFMLITDTFTVAQDFLTRWNYHRDVVSPTTQAVSSTVEPQVVSKEEFDQQVHKTKQWQLATGILTGLLACTVIVAAALLGTLRRKNNQLA
ncbi:juvenile hormone esterase-like isoform X4 [Cherax quadricarinatus]|uniref:juvenile hormone esterase-like isoform X4 n=1 Tax=Cherax quadricarinatus TaxID=27406 RepID=UPI00387E5423